MLLKNIIFTIDKKMKKNNKFVWWFRLYVGIKIGMKKARKVVLIY